MKIELLSKSRLCWTLLLMVAATTLSMPLYGVEVAKVTPVLQAAPPAINTAGLEKIALLKAKLPGLFIQDPSFVFGASCPCVSDWECEQQWGPGSLCTVPPGYTCGYCN